MSLLSSGTYLMLSQPDQFRRLDPCNPQAIQCAIEEFLRYESPVTRTPRLAGKTLELGNRRIRQGEAVTFLLGAVNRDPAQFPDPDHFDVTRSPNKHLAFGFGRHFCIGAELARLEAAIAFPMIFRQLPDLRLVSEDVTWRKAFGIRSLETLPVAVR